MRPRSDSRPVPNGRQSTAPSVLTMNGHFASVGEDVNAASYEHGIQIIDEDQDFK